MTKARGFGLGLTLATAASAGSLACTRGPGPAAAASKSEMVADGGGFTITRAELDRRVADQLARVRQEEYEIRRRALDQLLAEKLLDKEARARGVSPEALLKAEVEDKLDASFPPSQRDQAFDARKDAWAQDLAQKAGVRVVLTPPKFDVPVPASAPVLGPARAPVTIVEFSDYQCPYCRRAQGTVDGLLERYGDKVRFVYRDFPLENHPRAFAASRASRCAGEQGRFWDYHRGLFTRAGDLSEADLKGRAAATGLDVSAFTACLASDRHDPAIREAQETGVRLGVVATPTFFINGQKLAGARPPARFEGIIEQELAAAR